VSKYASKLTRFLHVICNPLPLSMSYPNLKEIPVSIHPFSFDTCLYVSVFAPLTFDLFAPSPIYCNTSKSLTILDECFQAITRGAGQRQIVGKADDTYDRRTGRYQSRQLFLAEKCRTFCISLPKETKNVKLLTIAFTFVFAETGILHSRGCIS